MGSLLAYLSFVWLISIKPPAIISTHTYVNPVVAVFLGLAADKRKCKYSSADKPCGYIGWDTVG
jgi:hypothetical protein